ncbi:Phenylalanine 4-hydroxylase [Reichenbachiella agariperforans]|uniref:Phenylalanine-4-hydroxylase n=1 Tax=Reichenbachiella agariperforans TaxID=156994 RepID=A0A1M6NGX9_REIAG|nr:phenylalanine 4-monooxygenase [Reichenbachiella agariperforans]SHJ95011.1 Phenylalanine 4-hydroxylase [Reichenbachiella agariperforans]
MLENKTPYDFPTEPMHQAYDEYTPEHFEVWKSLYQKQLLLLKSRASSAYLDGLDICGFTADKIPRLEETNAYLKQATGWHLYIVPGLIADRPFFEFLHNKHFPVTTWLRDLSQLEYLEEPDMFHDVFGHVPLLSNPHFSAFMKGLAAIALKHIDSPQAIELMSRLYWFTVEFGLIREDGEIKIYGAGIVSSPGESLYALEDPNVPRIPYDVSTVLDTPFYKHDFQKQYFVIDSYQTLFDSLPELEVCIAARAHSSSR